MMPFVGIMAIVALVLWFVWSKKFTLREALTSILAQPPRLVKTNFTGEDGMKLEGWGNPVFLAGSDRVIITYYSGAPMLGDGYGLLIVKRAHDEGEVRIIYQWGVSVNYSRAEDGKSIEFRGDESDLARKILEGFARAFPMHFAKPVPD